MNSPQWLHFQREVEFQRWNALTLVIWSLKTLRFHIFSHSDLPYSKNHLLKYITLKAGRQRIMDPRSTKGTFRSILEVRGTIHMQASNGRVLREEPLKWCPVTDRHTCISFLITITLLLSWIYSTSFSTPQLYTQKGARTVCSFLGHSQNY